MSISISFPSQDLLIITEFNSRRLLLDASSTPPVGPAAAASSMAAPPPQPPNPYASFDANVVMVLSILICALVCSLGFNAILKCAFRCSRFLASLSPNNARLVHTGVRRNVLKTFPIVEYSKEVKLKLPGLDSECVICLAEFESGERIRVLPKCYHGFHILCIDKWLSSRTSCPKCRNCLKEACRNIVDCRDDAASVLAPPVPQPPPPVTSESIIVDIAPLERENMICNYRESR